MPARFVVLTKTIVFGYDFAVTVVFACSSICQNNGAWCLTNQNSVDDRGNKIRNLLANKYTGLPPSQRFAKKGEM